jgi:hypothetical protein
MHYEMLAHDHTSPAKNGHFWQRKKFMLISSCLSHYAYANTYDIICVS